MLLYCLLAVPCFSLSVQSSVDWLRLRSHTRGEHAIEISKKLLTYKRRGKQVLGLPAELIDSIVYEERGNW